MYASLSHIWDVSKYSSPMDPMGPGHTGWFMGIPLKIIAYENNPGTKQSSYFIPYNLTD